MNLAEQLAQGVQASQRGAWDAAVTYLEPVFADQQLAQAEEMADIRARVASLYAQALLEAGRPREADTVCREALRALRRLKDRVGLDEVRKLQDRIVSALVEERDQEARRHEARRIAETSTQDLLAEATTPLEQAELLVKKADALGQVGKRQRGALLARRALQLATRVGDTRWAVIAHLSLARLTPSQSEQHVLSAYALAEQASEFNLVSMVARAAEVLSITLPSLVGPHQGLHGDHDEPAHRGED